MTAFSTQKQYTGYIELPPYTLAPIQQNYTINTFFWFVEARQLPESSPLTIWLSGGPGSSSMFGMFNEMGPCEVVRMTDGTYGTQADTWGWDRASNLLFIDQPNQVGFSYDVATNASFDLFSGQVFEPPTPPNAGLPKWMYLNGTFGTGVFDNHTAAPWAATANTTDIAARATWHFLQSWLSAFPQYNPAVRSNATSTSSAPASSSSAAASGPVGINLFAESYGGKYGPVFAKFFEQQNQARRNGSLANSTSLEIRLETLGIINGLIDDLIQDPYFPRFAYANSYGIETISQSDEINALTEFTNDCVYQIQNCRALMSTTDPEGYGDVDSTNDVCNEAQIACNNALIPYIKAGYYPYDVRQKIPSPDPPAAYQEYLNNETVLEAIGARVNYSESNPYVQQGFIATGDTIRGGLIQDLAYLLKLGVRVALIYGDADFLCNWFGGEAVSFAIANALPDFPAPVVVPGSNAPPTYASGFSEAGYAEIVTNDSYVGGAVRQYGNLSFSRVYGAGHFVPYYQPETAFTVFARAIMGSDISTGDLIDLSSYGSTGPTNATYNTTATYSPSPTCWVRAWNQSCDNDHTNAMLAGKGVVANGIFYLDDGDTTSGLPESTVAAGVPGHPMGTKGATTTALTGVYTATGTPKQSSAAAPIGQHAYSLPLSLWPLSTLFMSYILGVIVML